VSWVQHARSKVFAEYQNNTTIDRLWFVWVARNGTKSRDSENIIEPRMVDVGSVACYGLRGDIVNGIVG